MEKEKEKEKLQIDEIIKIIFMTDNKELVKFVNKNLGKNYDPENAIVIRLSTESNFKNTDTEQKYSKRTADAVFSIDDHLYNIEFQTTHDGKMLIRLMEYQFNAMLDKLKSMTLDNKYATKVILPHSIVIQLEKSQNVSNYYRLTYIDGSTGKTLTQKFPILKMWEHSIKDLSENGQHMLLPFKPLEHKKKNVDVDKFLEDIFDIKERIFNLYNNNIISKNLYEEMYEAHYNITKIIAENYITKDNPKRKEVDDMFTVIKERPSLVKQYVDKEVAKGIAEGISRGIAQKTLKAFELGWNEEDIINFFDISVEQAQQILDKG